MRTPLRTAPTTPSPLASPSGPIAAATRASAPGSAVSPAFLRPAPASSRRNGALSAVGPLEIVARGGKGGRESDLCRRRALSAGRADVTGGVREDHEGVRGGSLRADPLHVLSLDGFVAE